MVLLQIGKGGPPPPPAPGVSSPLPPSAPKGEVRKISETDLLDKLGLGEWADVAVMSVAALFFSVVMIGLMLWVLRKAFGSRDDMRKAYDDAEKMKFDLLKREASATARIAGLRRQIAAVESQLKTIRGV